MVLRKIGAEVGFALVGALVWGEVEHWRASRRRLGAGVDGGGSGTAVVVLGYRNAGERPNAVNRWRVRAGLRSLDGAGSVLVVCGGPVGGARPEADLLAGHARALGYRGPLLREPRSRTTWENVREVGPLLEGFARIKVVSNPFHAEKAREYLWRQHPHLAARLVRARDQRVGEWLLLKPLLAVRGRRSLRRVDAGGQRRA
ncbi:YdcF family protein [Actinosynnema sp.]|uniref:YdcF family protein n=1 Tax=Actinosynnema sp. TaxID=1872144 RepID=UPI003F873E5B